MSGKILEPRFFSGDCFQVMVQDPTVVSGNIFETDSQCESLVKNPSFNMNNPGPDLDWNAIDGEIQVNDLVAK